MPFSSTDSFTSSKFNSSLQWYLRTSLPIPMVIKFAVVSLQVFGDGTCGCHAGLQGVLVGDKHRE